MQSSRKDAGGTAQPEKRIRTGMTVQGIPAFKKEPPLGEEKREEAEAAPAADEKKENHVQKDNYFIYDQELGRGGMGVVYKGRHVLVRFGKKIERAVAIKEIKFEDSEISSDPNLLEQKKEELYNRFLSEVETVSKLKHRNIIDIRWFGETEEGRPFYVMEHLDGTDLDQYLYKKKTLGWEEIKPIVSQVCSALLVAHEYEEEEGEGGDKKIISKPIIHRDMKPANVFLTFDEEGKIERVVVLDFGLAKILVPRGPDDTFKGNAIDGTAEYMSPEQSYGLDVDHRSDIYAIGVMLYEMASGTPPFAPDFRMGTNFQYELKPKLGRDGGEVLRSPEEHLSPDDFVSADDWENFRNNRFYEFRDRLLEHPPARLTHVPDALQRIIFRCLEKKPENRFQSVRELKAEIEKLNGLAAWEGTVPQAKKPQEDEMALPSVMVRQSMLGVAGQGPHRTNAGTSEAEIEQEQTAITATPVPPEGSPWAAYAQPDSINPQDLPSSTMPQGADESATDQRAIKTQIVRARDVSRDKPTMVLPNKAAVARRSRRLIWATLGVAGALAVGGGTAAYFASKGQRQPDVADVEPLENPGSAAGTDGRPPPSVVPDAGPQIVAPPVQQVTFTITFRATPSGTELVHGGETFTCTPECRLTVNQGTAPLEFVFRKSGFRDRTERVIPDRDRTVRIRLERKGGEGGHGGNGQGSGRPIIITSPD